MNRSAGKPDRGGERAILPLLAACAILFLFSPLKGDSLTLTVRDAVLFALEHNGSLAVERFKAAAGKTYEPEERGAFDPTLSAGLSQTKRRSASGEGTAENTSLRADITVPLPTGTVFEGVADLSAGDVPFLGLSIGVSQDLLKGGKKAANLAAVKQAELQGFSSDYELRGFTEALVASVETAYWDFYSGGTAAGIYREGLSLAEQQLYEIRERVSLGALPAIEGIAAQAEVALRRESLLVAEGRLENARLELLNLINLPGEDLWEKAIAPGDTPAAPESGIDDLRAHLTSALRMRPDLNQAILEKRSGDLDVVQTKNGLLPRLELFISLGKTGYAESFSRAASDLGSGGLDLGASLIFSYPIGNRQARARNERALYTAQQAQASLDNLRRLVELDVRLAHADANLSRERIDVTVSSRSLQEEKLRAEMEKFGVGRSTALLVAQVQRDLLNSKISEEEALIGYIKSLVSLYRLDGSLLLRRGVAAPGEDPASPAAR